MIADRSRTSAYAAYLALDEILAAQRPNSDEHDEAAFIIAHQVNELWFKELLVEFTELRRRLDAGDTFAAQRSLRRCLVVFGLVMSPMKVLATLAPQQFARFRPNLGDASGFQSAQFREIEAVLGRRDRRMAEYFPDGGSEQATIERAMQRPSLFDSLLRYLAGQGHPMPPELLCRDVTRPIEPSPELQDALLRVYLEDGAEAQVCEGFAEADHAVQEWRYRHATLAQRLIGGKPGTGGSSGVSYLRKTLFTPLFPDLWVARSRL